MNEWADRMQLMTRGWLCVVPRISLGSYCRPGDICADVNAVCSDSACACRRGFYNDEGQCGTHSLLDTELFELLSPHSSDRQHLSYDDCLEVRGEIIRTALCCIVYWKLCTVISTLRWPVLAVLWIRFCLTGPISLCIDSCVYVFLRWIRFHVESYCICVVLL